MSQRGLRRSAVDFGFRTLYRVAYRMMRVYWAVRRPDTHGALVTVWHNDRVLLVQNSYTDYLSLPGGYVRPGETGRQAAVRELAEEVSLSVEPDQLELLVDETHEWEGKQDHVEIFSLELDVPPVVQVDHREILSAEFLSIAAARRRRVFPPALDAIEVRLSRQSA